MPRLRFLQAFKVLVQSGTLTEDRRATETVVRCHTCGHTLTRANDAGIAAVNADRRSAAAHVLHNHRRVYDSAVAAVADLKAEAAGATS